MTADPLPATPPSPPPLPVSITGSTRRILWIVGLFRAVSGALLLGLILGETEHSARLERLVVPFRDFFGGIFFFSFGLTVDPFSLGGAVWLSLGAALLSLIIPP
jgi:Kef-type K+ transport system membrane component KefB